jgi:sugar phosphate isomerase/epimerase
MKISYLIYEPIPDLRELARHMKHIAALGYHGIELSAAHPLGYSVDDVLALSKEFDLPVVSLLSGWSYSHEGLCLSSPDADVRRRAVARLIEYAGHAGRLGGVVVMGLMQGLRSDEPDEAKANDRIKDCLAQVARAAREQGAAIVLEPVNHQQVGFHNTAAEAAALVEKVNSPGLSYMLDTIHMNIEERSLLETIRVHGPRIRHFHLCESNGGPFGTGNLDFPAILRTLAATGYSHFVSVKIYRKQTWEEGSRSAATFLRGLGIEFRSR